MGNLFRPLGYGFLLFFVLTIPQARAHTGDASAGGGAVTGGMANGGVSALANGQLALDPKLIPAADPDCTNAEPAIKSYEADVGACESKKNDAEKVCGDDKLKETDDQAAAADRSAIDEIDDAGATTYQASMSIARSRSAAHFFYGNFAENCAPGKRECKRICRIPKQQRPSPPLKCTALVARLKAAREKLKNLDAACDKFVENHSVALDKKRAYDQARQEAENNAGRSGGGGSATAATAEKEPDYSQFKGPVINVDNGACMANCHELVGTSPEYTGYQTPPSATSQYSDGPDYVEPSPDWQTATADPQTPAPTSMPMTSPSSAPLGPTASPSPAANPSPTVANTPAPAPAAANPQPQAALPQNAASPRPAAQAAATTGTGTGAESGLAPSVLKSLPAETPLMGGAAPLPVSEVKDAAEPTGDQPGAIADAAPGAPPIDDAPMPMPAANEPASPALAAGPSPGGFAARSPASSSLPALPGAADSSDRASSFTATVSSGGSGGGSGARAASRPWWKPSFLSGFFGDSEAAGSAKPAATAAASPDLSRFLPGQNKGPRNIGAVMKAAGIQGSHTVMWNTMSGRFKSLEATLIQPDEDPTKRSP